MQNQAVACEQENNTRERKQDNRDQGFVSLKTD